MPVSLPPTSRPTEGNAGLTSFPFPVMCPAGIQQPTIRLTAGRRLSLGGISAVLLLGSVSVTQAQRDAAHPASALALANLTAELRRNGIAAICNSGIVDSSCS